MDVLDLYTIMLIMVSVGAASLIYAVVESIYDRRNARNLHRHVWGNVVDLKSWRNTHKRASNTKRW